MRDYRLKTIGIRITWTYILENSVILAPIDTAFNNVCEQLEFKHDGHESSKYFLCGSVVMRGTQRKNQVFNYECFPLVPLDINSIFMKNMSILRWGFFLLAGGRMFMYCLFCDGNKTFQLKIHANHLPLPTWMFSFLNTRNKCNNA